MGWALGPFPSPLGGGRGHAVTGLGLGVALVEVHGRLPLQLVPAAEHRGMYTIFKHMQNIYIHTRMWLYKHMQNIYTHTRMWLYKHMQNIYIHTRMWLYKHMQNIYTHTRMWLYKHMQRANTLQFC